MRFVGIRRIEGYVTVSTAPLVDGALTLKAKGLLALLYTWPLDTQVTVSGIVRLCSEGRTAVDAAWEELVKAGYLIVNKDGVQIHENREVIRGRFRGNLESAPAKTEKPLQETLKKTPTFSRKSRIEKKEGSPGIVVSITSTGISLSDSEKSANSLFPATIDPKAEVKMRESGIADPDVFRQLPEVRKLHAIGVDVDRYHRVLMHWSDKQNRTKKYLRSTQGWIATVLDAIESDKAKGKLVMQGAEDETDANTMKFWNLGR